MVVNSAHKSHLAFLARELFTQEVARALPELAQAINNQLLHLADKAAPPREMQIYRDGLLCFRAQQHDWIEAFTQVLQKAGQQTAASADANSCSSVTTPPPAPQNLELGLVDKELMENTVLSSRLALRLLDLASWELNDLRLRIRALEGLPDLRVDDIFRPEVLGQHLLNLWLAARLPREIWVRLQDLIQDHFSQDLRLAYHQSNQFLIQQGVMAEIDLRPLLRRSLTSPAVGELATRLALEKSQAAYRHAAPLKPSAVTGLAENGQMQGAAAPQEFSPTRALGVLSHLRRWLGSATALDSALPNLPNQPNQPNQFETIEISPALRQAMALSPVPSARGSTPTSPTGPFYVDTEVDGFAQTGAPKQLERVAAGLRSTSSRLKKAASNTNEKATIEIVALMFQSILAEERIAPALRVWFARLQMPVLRVAIAEPEFFGSLQHPARRLIDRMGSCVLGFDVTAAGDGLAREIRRVVQMVEQYPETGQQVFQLVYDEFDKFLSQFLAEPDQLARVVGIAQQIEQKDTLVIQYTIELRKLLNEMPVRTAIREFLFQVWAEVLAIAAMRKGTPQETLDFKQAAADLVWAASAKPNRSDRAKVIADLPKLLELLRQGMNLLNLSVQSQEAHINSISATLADAFMSKTAPIEPVLIDQMAKRLSNLDNDLGDQEAVDLPLDASSLITMMGIDACDLVVITDGGSQPNEVMRAWALALQLGAWFSLEHNERISRVQFVWRSERQQLHLFAAVDGRSFLIQLRCLSAYLQAGLLVPAEAESLTTRASREALTQLAANPERLLD